MLKPLIAVFSGPNSTIANSPTLVTSNKGRLPNEQKAVIYDHLVPQLLFEKVTVKIRKFSAHPLEADSREVYFDDGKDYYEVTLDPSDGLYPLPYVARRANGAPEGVPFELSDLNDPAIDYGGRQSFYPDASRIFEEIDRTVSGRSSEGVGGVLSAKASYKFIRVLPPAGYKKLGERPGIDYFPTRPKQFTRLVKRRELARAANLVSGQLRTGEFRGAIWLDGSPQLEESLYWLSLIVDSDLPLVGIASQRKHGELSNDGDRNIVDAVDYICSTKDKFLGAVGIQEQVIYAAREFKKADARPGNYKATGGHGGILGTVKSGVTIWYRPNYKAMSNSEVRLPVLPSVVEFLNETSTGKLDRIKIKDEQGNLLANSIPRVKIIKYASYSEEDNTGDPRNEIDVMAWLSKSKEEQANPATDAPKMHGLVFEGLASSATGALSQMKALDITALSGIPVVRVGRGDPGGKVVADDSDLTIEGSNLDATKARMLLAASMLKLGRLPRAVDPFNPSNQDKIAVMNKITEFQEIFETH